MPSKTIQSKKAIFLVAEREKEIIACGFGKLKIDDQWTSNKYVGYIGLIFVQKAYRRKGIGKKILNQIITWFKKKKIKNISLKVYAKNKKAINAYKKSGFKDHIIEMRL